MGNIQGCVEELYKIIEEMDVLKINSDDDEGDIERALTLKVDKIRGTSSNLTIVTQLLQDFAGVQKITRCDN